MITKEQIKAARAMLDWSQKTLAEQCADVSEPTIKLIETGKINSTSTTLGIIRATFEKAGLEFLPQKGVRFRDSLLTLIEKQNDNDNVYLRLMDDIYHTIRGKATEVLFSFVDQSLSPPEVVDRQVAIRKAGAPMRFLIRNGDDFMRFPVGEYRHLPNGYFLNNSTVIYGEKIAFVTNRYDKVIIIQDPDVAEIKRMEFELIWQQSEKPGEKSAKARTGKAYA